MIRKLAKRVLKILLLVPCATILIFASVFLLKSLGLSGYHGIAVGIIVIGASAMALKILFSGLLSSIQKNGYLTPATEEESFGQRWASKETKFYNRRDLVEDPFPGD